MKYLDYSHLDGPDYDLIVAAADYIDARKRLDALERLMVMFSKGSSPEIPDNSKSDHFADASKKVSDHFREATEKVAP